MSGAVRDNESLQRFELPVGDQIVFARYRLEPGVLTLTHVEAPPNLRGSGAAGRLMGGVAERARADGVKVVPMCGYARLWLQRHPEYDDLQG
jgi:predicted GNAT family acetyltransferase